MKNIIISLIAATLTIALPLGFVSIASADIGQSIVPQCSASGEINGQKTSFCSDVTSEQSKGSPNPLINIIKAVMQVVSYITGIAAIMLILISGLRFVTSGGDSGKVASARGAVIGAVIGLIITVLAQIIIVFVLDKVN